MCHPPTFKVPLHLFHAPIPPQDAFPNIMHQTWKSSDLPAEFQRSRQTCIDRNPTLQHMLWTDQMNRHFLKKHYAWFLETFDGYNSNIKRADAIRYFYMYHFGGVYADLDVKCIRPFDTLAPLATLSDVILGRNGNFASSQSIPNAIMASKPSSVFWLRVIENMATRSNCSTPMYDTGPEVLRATYLQQKGASTILLPSTSFYPLDWQTAEVGAVPHIRREQHFKLKNFSSHVIAYTYWRHSWG